MIVSLMVFPLYSISSQRVKLLVLPYL